MSNNVIPFCHPRRARDDIRRQACAWLVEIDAGLSEEHRERLIAWMSDDPAHADALLGMARFWDQIGVLSELSKLFPLAHYQPPPERRSGRWRLAAALAAVISVLVAGGFLAGRFPMLLDPGVERREAGTEVYETDVGEQLTLRLPDGSEVILNTATRIAVQYSATRRDIALQRGEGHFTVAHDPEVPFRVLSGTRVIEALGTSFTVYARPDSVEVTVMQGRVQLLEIVQPPLREPMSAGPRAGTALEAIALDAGDHAAVSRTGGEVRRVRLPPEEIEARMAWRHGMLLFQGEPLALVLREVSRYTRTRIDAEEQLRDIPVFAYIRAGDIDRLLAGMRENFEIDVQEVGENHLFLTGR